MKSRKFLLILFIVQLVLCLSLSVTAAENNAFAYTVESSDSIVKAGEEFTVSLTVTENSGICYALTDFKFDPAKVEFVSAEAAKLTTVDGKNKDIVVDVSAAKTGMISIEIGTISDILGYSNIYAGKEAVVTITFKALKNYAADTALVFSANTPAGMIGFDNDEYLTADVKAEKTVTAIDLLTHKHTPDRDSADCLNDKVCTVCGDVIEAKWGHDLIVDSAVEATCTEDGKTAGEHCTRCDYKVEQTVVKALGHDVVKDKAVAATCTTSGKTAGEHCKRCKEVLKKQDTVPALGHKLVKIEGTASTCTVAGMSDGEKCDVCGVVTKKQEALPLAEHTKEVIPGKAATCKEEGLTDGEKCAVCENILVAQEKIDKIAHLNDVTLDGKAATCKEEGLSEGKKCSACGDITVAQETIAKLAHTEEVLAAVEATCTKTGLTEGKKCSACGDILVAQNEVAKKDHTYGEWKVTVEATKKAAGEQVRECTACGDKQTEVIPQLPDDGSTMWIIIGAVLVVIAAGIVVFVVLKKKKNA